MHNNIIEYPKHICTTWFVWILCTASLPFIPPFLLVDNCVYVCVCVCIPCCIHFTIIRRAELFCIYKYIIYGITCIHRLYASFHIPYNRYITPVNDLFVFQLNGAKYWLLQKMWINPNELKHSMRQRNWMTVLKNDWKILIQYLQARKMVLISVKMKPSLYMLLNSLKFKPYTTHTHTHK